MMKIGLSSFIFQLSKVKESNSHVHVDVKLNKNNI